MCNFQYNDPQLLIIEILVEYNRNTGNSFPAPVDNMAYKNQEKLTIVLQPFHMWGPRLSLWSVIHTGLLFQPLKHWHKAAIYNHTVDYNIQQWCCLINITRRVNIRMYLIMCLFLKQTIVSCQPSLLSCMLIGNNKLNVTSNQLEMAIHQLALATISSNIHRYIIDIIHGTGLETNHVH